MLQRIPVLVDFAEFNPALRLVHCPFPPGLAAVIPPLGLVRRTFEALYRERGQRTSTAVEMALDGGAYKHHREARRD